MAKSKYEKLLEKQIKQQKNLEREQKRESRKAATRERAATVVNGAPIIDGMRLLDETAEEVLRCLLECDCTDNNMVSFVDDIFPGYLQLSIGLELEKLVQYGMITTPIIYDNGGFLTLLPKAFSYFDDKVIAQKKQKEKEEQMSMRDVVNYGNLVIGNVVDSTLTVDNSIQRIEKAIDEYGEDDKAELREMLDEVKELIENIEFTRAIPKQQKLHQKLSAHAVKHSWFYGAITELLGTTVLNVLGV